MRFWRSEIRAGETARSRSCGTRPDGGNTRQADHVAKTRESTPAIINATGATTISLQTLTTVAPITEISMRLVVASISDQRRPAEALAIIAVPALGMVETPLLAIIPALLLLCFSATVMIPTLPI
jgi:hypothetical protein